VSSVPTGPAPAPLRVLELSQGLSGAVCGRLLAGLGHDVVKCEPSQGDYLRSLGAWPGEPASAVFLEANAGKRGLVADGAELGEEQILELAGRADIVIADAEPCALRLSAPALRRSHPGLVVVAVSTFGIDETYPDAGCDSLLAEAYGGLAFMIGEPDCPPLALGGEQAAYMAGMVALLGAMLAVRRRSLTGEGDLVDVALTDAAAYLDWKSDVLYAAGGAVPRRTGAAAGRWRLVPASDGWVGVIFQGREWPALVEMVGDPRLDDPRLTDDGYRAAHPDAWWPAVTEWAAGLPRAEIYQRAQALRLPFGQLLSLPELEGVAQYQARGFMPAADGTATVGSPVGPGLPWHGGRAPALGEHQAGVRDLWTQPRPPGPEFTAPPGPRAPLAGIRVIDLGTITSGAGAGRILADYGAEVIKVESPDRPDSFRRWIVDTESPTRGAEGHGIAPLFDSNNAGKLGISLDLKTPDALNEFMRLVAGADGVTERLGISFDDLRAVNPRLVYLSLSSQGQRGPEAAARSYGSTLDLLSGLASLTGYDGGHPMWSSVAVNYPDQLAAVFGAAAATAVLVSGAVGVHLDISQREVVSWTLAGQIRESLTVSGARPADSRREARSPHDIYQCSGLDEWIAVSCRTDDQRRRLAEVVGFTAAASAGPGGWAAVADAVELKLAAWTAARPAPECVPILRRAGVPCAPVSTARTRADDPHFARRRVYLDDGDRRLKGFPLVMSGYQPPVPPLAPRLGEHNGRLPRSAMTDPPPLPDQPGRPGLARSGTVLSSVHGSGEEQP